MLSHILNHKYNEICNNYFTFLYIFLIPTIHNPLLPQKSVMPETAPPYNINTPFALDKYYQNL